MDILLLGGTGAVGVPLSLILLEMGHEVYVTTRNVRKSEDDRIHYVIGNAHDKDFLFGLIKQKRFDAIVDFMVYSEDEFSEKYGTLLNYTEQYIFLSSARVFSNNNIITEHTERLLDVSKDIEFINSKEYAISKAIEENYLLRNSNRNWTIVRPYITYFTERLQLGTLEKEDWLFRVNHKKSIVFSKDIANKYTTMTNGYDVADCISRIIGNERTLGKAYNCVSSECCTWEEILSIYLECIENILGKRPDVFWVDKHEDMGLYSYQARYDRMFDRRFDNSSIIEDLGKTHFISIREGLSLCLTQFLVGEREFRKISWSNQGLYDKITNEKTNLYEIKGVFDKIRYIYNRYIL